MNRFDLSHVIRRSWWLPVLTTLVAVNVSLFLAYNATPMYEAKATFVVYPGGGLAQTDELGNLVDSFNTLDNRPLSITYSEIMQSDRTFKRAGEILNLDALTLGEYERTAVVLPESNVLVLSVIGPDPEIATNIANTVGVETITYASAVYEVYEITMLDQADVPDSPMGSGVVRGAIIAAIFGLIIGVVLMVLREVLLSAAPTELKPVTAHRMS